MNKPTPYFQYQQESDKPVVLIFGGPDNKPTSVLANPLSQPISIPIGLNLQPLFLEEAERLFAALGNAINILRGPNPETVLIGARDPVYIEGQPVEHLTE